MVCDEWNRPDGYLKFKEWAIANGYKEWSKELNIKHNTLYSRLNSLGWDIEKAFTTKPNQTN